MTTVVVARQPVTACVAIATAAVASFSSACTTSFVADAAAAAFRKGVGPHWCWPRRMCSTAWRFRRSQRIAEVAVDCCIFGALGSKFLWLDSVVVVAVVRATSAVCLIFMQHACVCVCLCLCMDVRLLVLHIYLANTCVNAAFAIAGWQSAPTPI